MVVNCIFLTVSVQAQVFQILILKVCKPYPLEKHNFSVSIWLCTESLINIDNEEVSNKSIQTSSFLIHTIILLCMNSHHINQLCQRIDSFCYFFVKVIESWKK